MKRLVLLIIAAFSFIASYAQSADDEAKKQRDALIAFYNSTDGPNWTKNTNWCSDLPLNQWYGIEAVGNKVTRIQIRDNNLHGPIPEEFGDLTSLTYIDLTYNSITGELPESMAKLTNVAHLRLGANEITKIPESMIKAMTKLVEVNMFGNKLTELSPLWAERLDGIEDTPKHIYNGNFDFSTNRITGKLPKEITSHKAWSRIWYYTTMQNGDTPLDLTDVDIPYMDFKYVENNGNTLEYKNLFPKNKHTVIVQLSKIEKGTMAFVDDLYALYKAYHKDGLDVIIENLDEGTPDYEWHTVDIVSGKNKAPFYYINPQTTIVDQNGNIVYSTFIYIDDNGRFNHYRDQFIPWLESIYGTVEKVDRQYTSTDYSADSQVKLLNEATEGNGIDFVIMGDGYTDRDIASGAYEEMVNETMEAIFASQPMGKLRNMCNVYSVTAVSPNDFYSANGNTTFGVYTGSGSYIGGNDAKAREYALKAITPERFGEAVVIVVANLPSRGGTCFMNSEYADHKVTDYASGTTFSYIPKNSSKSLFESTIIHEAVGHGFAKLLDEYQENGTSMSDQYKEALLAQFKEGVGKNIDLTSDRSKVKWAHFLTDTRYAKEGLGVFEGAATVAKGAYRPSKNSVMNQNQDSQTFNAPSREAIWFRANKIAYGASWQYNFEDFVAFDLNGGDLSIKPVINEQNNGTSHDLMGRRVTDSYHGIVIKDGKKYIK